MADSKLDKLRALARQISAKIGSEKFDKNAANRSPKKDGILIDGIPVANCTKQETYRPEFESEETNRQQDDYVLCKLFKKIHSAVQHDVVSFLNFGIILWSLMVEEGRIIEEEGTFFPP